jgi:hypothetical protein
MPVYPGATTTFFLATAGSRGGAAESRWSPFRLVAPIAASRLPRPPVVRSSGRSLRWVTADHGDDALLLAVGQHLGCPWLQLVVESPFETALLVAMADLRMACGVNGTTAAIFRELTPSAHCKSATARRTTRTCCTPPLNSLRNAFWSLGVTVIRGAGRATR